METLHVSSLSLFSTAECCGGDVVKDVLHIKLPDASNNTTDVLHIKLPDASNNTTDVSNDESNNADENQPANKQSDGPECPSASSPPSSPPSSACGSSSKKRALSPSAALYKTLETDGVSPGFSSPTNAVSLTSAASLSPEIDPHDLTLLKVIGRGTFAQQVALARHRATQDVYVVKTLDKQRLIQRKQVAHTLTEKKVLETLGGSHPFIVKLFSAFQTDKDLNFVLEYCQGGELFFHLQQQQQQKFSEAATVFYAAEVLSALRALHAKGIVYRDLKPENVLLDAQGHVKLADFGFAKEDMADGKRTFSFCGSPEYLSPEMVEKNGHGVETDMWSFGCFIYELLTGNPPFQNGNLRRLFDLIQQGRVWYPPFLSGHAVSLLQGLLRVSPSSRFTAKQAMDHAFFQSLDWDELLQRQVAPPIVPECESHECTQNFDDGFTSEPVKSLGLVAPRTTSTRKTESTTADWTKRPRSDSSLSANGDVFACF